MLGDGTEVNILEEDEDAEVLGEEFRRRRVRRAVMRSRTGGGVDGGDRDGEGEGRVARRDSGGYTHFLPFSAQRTHAG